MKIVIIAAVLVIGCIILKFILLAFLGCVKIAQAFLELFEDWTGRI